MRDVFSRLSLINLMTVICWGACLALAACTFQLPADTPSGSGLTPPVEITEVSPQPSPVVELTPEIVLTQEIGASSTESQPVDIWMSINPQGERVIFWYFLEPQSARDKALNRMVDLFNATNTYGITADAFNLSTSNEVLSRTLSFAGTPSLPSLVMTDAGMLVPLHEAGVLIELSSLLESPTWGLDAQHKAGILHPFLQQAQSPDLEGIFAFPISRDATINYYNLEWLTELGSFSVPKISQEMETAACAGAQRAARRARVISPVGYRLGADLATLMSWTISFGGEVYNADQNTYILNSSEAVAAMQFLQGMVSQNCLSLSLAMETTPEEFGAGGILFSLDRLSAIKSYEQAASDDLAFAWNIHPLFNNFDLNSVFIHPGLNLSITNTSIQQRLAAWLLLLSFQTPESIAIWVEASGEFPLFANIAAGLRMPVGYRQAGDWFRDSPIIPELPGYSEIDLLAQEALVAIMEGANARMTLTTLHQAAENIVQSP